MAISSSASREAHSMRRRLASSTNALRACFGDGWVVRCQMPIALDDESEPEPDVAVAPGARRDYATDHPSRPVLVVEVAESSLSDDRAIKAARNPFATSPPLEAWRYDDVTILGETASIAPLARPEVPVDVATLLPVASSYLG